MTPPFAEQLNLRLCHCCRLACPADESAANCPRCGSPLHMRKPNAIARTWALMLAALVFYIPANVLPIMHTDALYRESSTTILGSVVTLWQGGAWDIAAIIFIASVGVPVTKFLVLGLLLITVQRGSLRSRRERTVLYRALELIGYWSMLDVFVAALLVSLVQFGVFGTIEPRLGILFFGLVVVLTMLAAQSFDPRLIWDTEPRNE
ncbi:paraquat-inducible protein A [Marinobacter fonticola]|uniref:paraquat-inducible protein A n=1 Tax=Marinobacter fonticola TaxID=2603215 RepID=UPI00143D1F56|nr:paraquat-inducible protein A [Marinobacter fonticola]